MPAQHPVIAALDWILTKPEFAGNMSALTVKAGLKRGHVEQIMKRRLKPERLPRDTAIKLARAGDVRLEWFMTGKGQREPFVEPLESVETLPSPSRYVENEDKWPTRAQFKALARLEGEDEALLALLDVEQSQDGRDPGLAYWGPRLAELKKIRLSIRQGRSDEGVADELEAELRARKPAARTRK